MTAPRPPIYIRRSREWRVRWIFFLAGIAFAAVWVAL